MDSSEDLNIQQEQAYPTPYATSPLLPLLLMCLALQKHSPRTKTSFDDEYDYIVVGAGSAGATVASRLSEEPCVSVLLLEAGKPPPRLTDLPSIPRYFVNTDVDWQYFTTPQKYTGAAVVDRKIPWPSGKMLGGSSSLNTMMFVRGNRRNYDEWAELGAEGWSYEDCLPYFKKLEDNTDPEYLKNGYHGKGGPITASRPNYNPIKKLAAMKAVENEGFVFVDANAREQNGFFEFQASNRDGQRCSTAKGYLVPAENRTNLDIVAEAMVRKVLIENKRATGVELDFDGSTYQVKARREVILSAGAVNSAQLLMLSGIGPMSELMKFKIPLVADLPVGLNMQDHPAAAVTFEVNDTLPRFEDELEDEECIQSYINNREGALASAQGFYLMASLSKSKNGMEGIPDYTVNFADVLPIQSSQGGLTQEAVEQVLLPLAKKSLLHCTVHLLHPYSIGTVSLQSADPYDPPVIDPNFFEDFRDIYDMVHGLKVCLRILNNPALKEIGAKPVDVVFPGCEPFASDTDLYLKCIVRSAVVTTNHQAGTARMGDPNDPRTVVDPQLRVKGVQGLRVVDASIMPTVPWSNTNVPSIMVGEKASDIIKSTIQCNSG